MNSDQIILVNEADEEVGVAEKLAAHQNGGRLHRAFSIFIFDSAGRMLLQRRATTKYHFGGLWTNACCSHPRPGQSIDAAAHARLQEEFGFDVPLTEAFCFIYRAHDSASGLTEHELDHVFLGRFDGTPRPNPAEIDEWEWSDPRQILSDLEQRPERYSPWFRIALERVIAWHRNVNLC